MASGIYQITNTVTGRFYIGSAVNFKKRFDMHKWSLKANRHHNYYLQRSYNKHGVNAFTYKIIEYVDDVNKLIEREQYYIDSLGAYKDSNGYNLSPTAGSTLGKPCREDVKRKISETQKGQRTGEKASFYGRKHTEETKLKMRMREKLVGERHGKSTTTEKQAREVKLLLDEGKLKGLEIAKKVGVSTQVVSKIRNGRTWSHLKIN